MPRGKARPLGSQKDIGGTTAIPYVAKDVRQLDLFSNNEHIPLGPIGLAPRVFVSTRCQLDLFWDAPMETPAALSGQATIGQATAEKPDTKRIRLLRQR